MPEKKGKETSNSSNRENRILAQQKTKPRLAVEPNYIIPWINHHSFSNLLTYPRCSCHNSVRLQINIQSHLFEDVFKQRDNLQGQHILKTEQGRLVSGGTVNEYHLNGRVFLPVLRHHQLWIWRLASRSLLCLLHLHCLKTKNLWNIKKRFAISAPFF